jgi:hypothetical protein
MRCSMPRHRGLVRSTLVEVDRRHESRVQQGELVPEAVYLRASVSAFEARSLSPWRTPLPSRWHPIRVGRRRRCRLRHRPVAT